MSESAKDRATVSEQASPSKNAEAGGYMLSGAAVAAIGVAGAVVGGAVCPVCVVASPALIGVGLYKYLRRRRSDVAE